MTEFPSAPEVARKLADALEEAGIDYAVGGAIAYGLHAPPRATNDVDLNVFVELDDQDRVFDALVRGGAEVSRDSARGTAAQRGAFAVRVSGMRIDVFIPSIPLYASVVTRIQTAVLLGRPIMVLSAEDITLFKLLFFRPKDISDIQRLVAFQGEALDHGYIRRWLVEMVGEDDERVETWDRVAGPG